MRCRRLQYSASLIVPAALAFGAFLLLTASSALALTPHGTVTADTYSCAGCHSSHTGTDRALLRTTDALDPVTATCAVCHAGAAADASDVFTGEQNSFGLDSGHSLDPAAQGAAAIRGCRTCHDPHGSATEIRNIPVPSINGATLTSAGIELCVSCHDAQNSWYGGDYPSTALPTRNATGYPVSGTWPGPQWYSSTSNAHRLIPESTRTVGLSEPIRREQGDCLYCHASHRGPNDYDGLVATFTVSATSTLSADQADGSYAALCFRCHGETGASELGTSVVDIAQFATGSESAGHRIQTPGGSLPVGAPLPCFECHNPHGSQRGNASLISDERGSFLSTGEQAGVRAFCFTCHSTSDTASGWDSETAAYVALQSEASVVGLPRTGALLRLPPTDGHDQSDTASCYECHGGSYAEGGNNVHNPGPGPLILLTMPVSLTSELPTASVETTGSLVLESIEATASADLLGATAVAAAIEPTVSAASTDSSPTPESIVESPSIDATGAPPDNPLPVDPTVPLQPDNQLALTGLAGALTVARRTRAREDGRRDSPEPPAP